MKKTVIVALTAALAFTGCDSLKDAMSAHTNVVAKAADQELTVTRLADLMGNSKAPLREDVAHAVVDAWVDYHLAGEAAANNDSLKNVKDIDEAMWAMVANIKARKWYESVSKTWKAPDAAMAETAYNDGTMMAASHILIVPSDTTPAGRAAAKAKADALRPQATAANFADLAKRNSGDPGSAAQGGSLGVFPPGTMVKEFNDAVAKLKPGEISPVIETQFGYHIIRRPAFSEVKADVVRAIQQDGTQIAEQQYLEGLEKSNKVVVKEGIAPAVRAIVEYPAGHTSDKTVLATSSIGKFTGGDLARWMETFPPQAQIAERVKSAPDSLMPTFVKNFVRNELVLHSADSAKMIPDSAQMGEVRRVFRASLASVWTSLDLDPAKLQAAAKSKSDRLKLAAQRVETYIGKLLGQQAQYVEVPTPVQNILRDKYDYTVNPETISQVLLEAAKVRLASDSTAKATQPGSVVPLPNQDTTKK
jgi:peptidyl-prolyl cis-trans isomerase D